MSAQQFAISYDGLAWLAALFGAGPRLSRVEVGADQVRVRMGSSFRLDIPRSSVRGISQDVGPVGATRGVHGRDGRWLVNGSAEGLVRLTLDPPCYTERGIGTRLRRAIVRSLTLSLADPDGFIAALRDAGT
jgi:hypothetical protein